MTKRCFVIAPIGDEGTEVREHSDEVFEFIIEPAMKECGIKPIRSDFLHQAGQISTQIYDAIQTYELCVVVLTYENPNVFYELAIAQCAVKPVIPLIEKGKKLPFDLKDERAVFYDLKLTSHRDRTYIDQIISIVKNLEENNWEVPSSIPGFKPRDETGIGDFEYFQMTQKYGDQDDWAKLLINTRERFELLSKSGNSWKLVQDFAQKLRQKGQEGCKIRILIYHKENPSLREIINERIEEKSYNMRCAEIDINIEFYKKIAESSDNIEVRQMLKGCPSNTFTITDEYTMYIPYFYSEKALFTPLFKCKKDSSIYSLLEKEFESLWEMNG